LALHPKRINNPWNEISFAYYYLNTIITCSSKAHEIGTLEQHQIRHILKVSFISIFSYILLNPKNGSNRQQNKYVFSVSHRHALVSASLVLHTPQYFCFYAFFLSLFFLAAYLISKDFAHALCCRFVNNTLWIKRMIQIRNWVASNKPYNKCQQ